MTSSSVTIRADSADELADALTMAAWGIDPFEADVARLPHSLWIFLERTQEALEHEELDPKLNVALRYGWFEAGAMPGDNEYWRRIAVLFGELSGLVTERLGSETAPPDDAV